MKCPSETNCMLCEWFEECSLRNNGEEELPEMNEDSDYYDCADDFNIEV